MYQFKREPLTADEATRLANAASTHEERLIVWTLLDTGLRVAELANLKRSNVDWQTHRIMVYGKGGPYGTKSKRRVIPLTARVRPLIYEAVVSSAAWAALARAQVAHQHIKQFLILHSAIEHPGERPARTRRDWDHTSSL